MCWMCWAVRHPDPHLSWLFCFETYLFVVIIVGDASVSMLTGGCYFKEILDINDRFEWLNGNLF